MEPRLSIFVTILGLFLTTATANIRCLNDIECISWYENPTWCLAGYQVSTHKVPGHPLVHHCERPCNNDEQKQCTTEICVQNRRDFDTYPGSAVLCRRALTCGNPVKTTKDICTTEYMRQAVEYNTTTGLCSVDSSVDLTKYGPGNEEIVFKVAVHALPQGLRMTCGGLSDKGASGYWRKLATGHKGLHYSFSHVGLCWTDDQSVMDRIMQTGQQACDQAQSSFHHETVFHHENVQRDLLISAISGGLGF